MAMFNQDDAWAIAEKLEAKIESGRAHELAVFRYQGKRIADFGIRRASQEKGHDYIPKELFLTPRQCRDFRRCSMTLKAYVELLVEKGHIVREIRRASDLKIARAGDSLNIECELSDEPDVEWMRDFGTGPPGSKPFITQASLTSRTVRVTAETGQSRESIAAAIDERIEHANGNAAKRPGGRHRQA